MIRRSFQEGYVSKPQKSRNGVFFEIRYRTPLEGGKWRQCSERLYGLSGRKAAKEILRDRLDKIDERPAQDAERITFKRFVDAYFKPSLERAALKPSTLYGYYSSLDKHLIAEFGDLRLFQITPIHVERFVQSKMSQGRAQKPFATCWCCSKTFFHWLPS
jgi:integrase-like protein